MKSCADHRLLQWSDVQVEGLMTKLQCGSLFRAQTAVTCRCHGPQGSRQREKNTVIRQKSNLRVAITTAHFRYGRIGHIFPSVANRSIVSLLDLPES